MRNVASARRRWTAALSVSGLCSLATAAFAPAAHADLSDCGDIYVEANASCEVVPPSVQCEAMCTPISVRASCTAQLAAECEAGCDELPSVNCTAECYAGCEGRCKVDPGKFDCEAACGADCSGRCAAQCAADSDGANCKAQCMGSCGVSCQHSCDVRFPSVDCKAKCEAGCEGSCKVDTNFDCQIDCQAKGYAECEADVTGGCKARCQSQQGALFCQGQYVDHGDNLQMCIDSLRAVFDVDVEGEASGDADCEGTRCKASGQASVGSDCSTSGPGRNPANLWALFALVSAILAYMLRVRNPDA